MADEIPPLSAQAMSAPATPRMAPLAIVSVVLGVLSFLCIPIIPVIPAIVCGHVAWSKINKSGGALQGKGIAIVGLIVGYLAIPWGGPTDLVSRRDGPGRASSLAGSRD